MSEVLISGVGGGRMSHWIFNEFGNFLSAYGIRNQMNVSINLKSEEDIANKLSRMEKLKVDGLCTEVELQELKEKVRTLSNFTLGGNRSLSVTLGNPTDSSCFVEEGKKWKKGQKSKTYYHGELKEITHRGSRAVSTPEQEASIEKARQYAHTPQANENRRKSINARKDAKVLKK